MDNKENMNNTEKPNQSVWNTDIISTNCKYYKRWDMLIIYDDYLQIPFNYINGERKEMDRNTFNDYAEEVAESDLIDTLFTDKIKEDYVNTLQKVYDAFRVSATLQSKEEKNQIDDLEKKL